jgi:hypothetical protein
MFSIVIAITSSISPKPDSSFRKRSSTQRLSAPVRTG